MMRRYARQHDTAATQSHEGVRSEVWWEHPPGKRVLTVDGPGRVEAVHDGPFPGAEEYEIVLEGGLGGGLYGPGQITAALPAQASVEHTAADDYPELGNLLHERPDPATIQYTAALTALGRSINGEEIDHHGTAPDWVRAEDPNSYDQQSTEGEPDPEWLEDADDRYKQVTASRPEDEKSDEHGTTGARSHDNGAVVCYVEHDGPCPTEMPEPLPEPPSSHHLSMPSKRHPAPQGFSTKIVDYPGHDPQTAWKNKRLEGYHDGRLSGYIDFHAHPRGEALKVDMLSTNYHAAGKGIASAMMDHLYEKHPDAWINHGWRTHEGLKWWNSYDDPDASRNVHTSHPSAGWDKHFEPGEVAGNIHKNENNDPGHYDAHGGVPDWAHDYDHDYDGGGDYDDPYEEKDKEEKDEPEAHDPDPRETPLHHGTSVHLSPQDHRIVHDYNLPDADRARHLLDVIGRGNMPSKAWHKDEGDAQVHAHNHAESSSQGHMPPTKVVFHAKPFEHDEIHTQNRDDGEDPSFDTDGRSAHFDNKQHPINFKLSGISWGEARHSSTTNTHRFHGEEVGMPLADLQQSSMHDYHPDPAARAQRAGWRQEHEERYRTPNRPLNPPGTGEQKKLFAKQAHQVMPSNEDPDHLRQHLVDHHGYSHDQLANLGESGQGDEVRSEHELEHEGSTYDDGVAGAGFGRGEVEQSWVPHSHDPNQSHYLPAEMDAMRDMLNPGRGGRTDLGTPDRPIHDVKDYDYSRDLAALPGRMSSLSRHALSSLLITAAMDPEFRFQITASWRDVQNKARRIRTEGGVEITHATDAMVIGNVRGDHNVYESGLQRMPGKRTSVAQYSCGCKWGAYHWGASDDLSRFAGRMCSHALALQYEAQSRGMFGRDVTVDDLKPRWVPPKVVVKYDIDTGQHMRAESSLPEVPEPERTFSEHVPLMVVMALAADDDPAMPFLAAVNDMFGDNSGRSEPSLMDPMGATEPWDKNQNPTSAGPLRAAEPDNWGSITNPSMFPSMASLIRTEAFWDKVAEAAGPSDDGAEATLHDEPEGALPETDGTEHTATVDEGRDVDLSPEEREERWPELTASLGDVDIVNDTEIGDLADDALSPENPSVQTHGSVRDIVAEFQKSAGAQAIMSGAPKGQANDGMDLAAAADAYLSKTAGFSAAERRELIDEAPGTQASNTDRLDIAGTHYADLEEMDAGEDDDSWLM